MTMNMSRGQATLAVVLVPLLFTGATLASPYSVSILSGNSMEPAADSCDLMLVDTTQTDLDDYEKGDWMRFESVDGSTKIHQVIDTQSSAVFGDWMIHTKGLNNKRYDAGVYPDKVRGKVIAHLPTPDC